MRKYSFEFKKQVVMDYLQGDNGARSTARKYGIPDHRQVQDWVRAYQIRGDEGLMPCKTKKEYSFETKLSVVQSYLESDLSCQEVAFQNGITSPSMVSAWVNAFLDLGPDALRPHKKGRRTTMEKKQMAKANEKNIQEERQLDTSPEHVQELEDELLKLRIENAFLKEMRRLRLEDEAKMRESRKSSTASEENSD